MLKAATTTANGGGARPASAAAGSAMSPNTARTPSAAGAGRQALEHRRRRVEPPHLHTRRRHRHRQPTAADAELEHRPARRRGRAGSRRPRPGRRRRRTTRRRRRRRRRRTSEPCSRPRGHRRAVVPPARQRAGRNDGDGRPVGRSGHPGAAGHRAGRPGRTRSRPAASTGPVTTGVLPLRPLTIPDILDGALRAWKSAPATMAALAAAFVVPTQLLLGFLTRDAVEDIQIGGSFADALAVVRPGGRRDRRRRRPLLPRPHHRGHGPGLRDRRRRPHRHRLVHRPPARLRRRPDRLAPTGVAAGRLVAARPPHRGTVRHRPVRPGDRADGAGSPWSTPSSPASRSGRSRPCAGRPGCAAGASARCSPCASSPPSSTSILGGALTALGGLYLELDLPAGWVVNTAVSVAAPARHRAVRRAARPRCSTSTCGSAPRASTSSWPPPGTSGRRHDRPDATARATRPGGGPPAGRRDPRPPTSSLRPDRSFVQRALDWILRQLERLFGGDGDGPVGAGGWRWLRRLGVVHDPAARSPRRWSWSSSSARSAGRGLAVAARILTTLDVDVDVRRSASAWDELARRLEAEGRWKDAMRARFGSLVERLVDGGLVADVPGRTTGRVPGRGPGVAARGRRRVRARPRSCSTGRGTATSPRVRPRPSGSPPAPSASSPPPAPQPPRPAQ